MNKTKDMTVGSPTKTIFFFSVPVLLGTLFQQIYNMADTIIVGQFLGEDALAAVGATGSTVYLVIGFASGLTQGCGILVSQAFGGHRLNELKKVVGTALLLTVMFSVILTIPTVSFSRQILLALHTPSNVLLYAHEYLRVIFGGILCTMAYNIAASILRSLGDSRTPLYFLILSSFLNIVLDIFFIATLHMGTAGAAWATVLSQGISALLCFLVHVSQLQQSTSQYPRSVPRSLSDSVYDTKRHSHGFKPNRYGVWNYDSAERHQSIRFFRNGGLYCRF